METFLKILIPIALMIAVKYDALRDECMSDIYKVTNYNDRYRGLTEKIFFPIFAWIFGDTWERWSYAQKLWHTYKNLSMFSLYVTLCIINIVLYNFAWYSFIEVLLLAFVCNGIWAYFAGEVKT